MKSSSNGRTEPKAVWDLLANMKNLVPNVTLYGKGIGFNFFVGLNKELLKISHLILCNIKGKSVSNFFSWVLTRILV